MRCPDIGDWSLLSMGLLDDAQSAALRSHAVACAACGDALQGELAVDADLRLLHADTEADHDQLRRQLLNQLPALSAPAAPGRGAPSRPAEKGLHIMHMISRHPIGAAGIAAALLVAMGIGFLVPRSSVAWADVARRIERVTSVSVRKTTSGVDKDGKEFSYVKMSFASEQFGQRVDTYRSDGRLFMTEYMLPPRGEWVTVFPGDDDSPGQFKRTEMSDDDREKMAAYTPASWAAALLNLGESEQARALEHQMLNGRETAVFESGRLTVWVDVQTRLPVRLESHGAYLEVNDDFRWDEPLAASLFVPQIPAGYVDISEPDPVKNPQSWLAEVVKEVNSVYAIEYDTRTTRRMKGVPQPVMALTGKRYFAEGLGVRTETYQNGVLIVLEIYNRKQNTWLWISHPSRKYNLVEFADGEEKQGGWHLTPEHWIEGFAQLPESEHVKHLDVKLINFRRVRGFETRATLPDKLGGGERVDRYWIDDHGQFPSRCEHIVPMANGMGELEMIEENFVYNPRLEVEMFEIDVPEGYQLLTEDGGEAPQD